jgi:hypothetical protein
MDDLLEKLDGDDAELVDRAPMIDEGPAAFNQEAQFEMKYNIAVSVGQTASKKRGLAEMAKPAVKQTEEPAPVVEETPAEPQKRRFNPFAATDNTEIDEELKAQEANLVAQQKQQAAEDEAAAKAVAEIEAAEEQQQEQSNVEMESDSKPKVATIDPLNAEWETLNKRNEQDRVVSEANTGMQHPVKYNDDGSLSFYWFDAHEETYGADIYLFGKVWQPETN